MNCQTFSELAGDIARDQMMDAAARVQALAHADDCVSCAVQLTAHQQLTSNLRELVAATKDETTSPVVWERLSAAFDSRRVTHLKSNRRRGIYAAGAIAAMLILALGLVQIARHRQSTNVEAAIAATFPPAPPVQTTDERKEKNVIVAVKQKSQVVRHRLSPLSTTAGGLTLPVNQPKEIATDFILLTYDGEVGSEAQLVRMELPRSAMASFGLPVNMDRADQRVKADVLLGADGLARAIRFVQ
jgi:hypothetical protein